MTFPSGRWCHLIPHKTRPQLRRPAEYPPAFNSREWSPNSAHLRPHLSRLAIHTTFPLRLPHPRLAQPAGTCWRPKCPKVCAAICCGSDRPANPTLPLSGGPRALELPDTTLWVENKQSCPVWSNCTPKARGLKACLKSRKSQLLQPRRNETKLASAGFRETKVMRTIIIIPDGNLSYCRFFSFSFFGEFLSFDFYPISFRSAHCRTGVSGLPSALRRISNKSHPNLRRLCVAPS